MTAAFVLNLSNQLPTGGINIFATGFADSRDYPRIIQQGLNW